MQCNTTVTMNTAQQQQQNYNKYNKYKNNRTEIDGIVFDSQKEAKYYLKLLILQKAGEVTDIECHPKYILQSAYWKCCKEVSVNIASKHICPYCDKRMPKTSAVTYSADFKVTYSDGHIEIVDVKGVQTQSFKDKRKMFEYQNPELTLKIV